MRKAILVTGAASALGSQVIEYLTQYPVDIRAAVHHHPMPLPANYSAEAIRAVPFDYEDPSTYAKALEGVEALFLVAPTAGANQAIVHPFLDYLTTYKGPLNHIAALSFMGTTPGNGSAYGDIEEHLQVIGLPYTLLRTNWMMQNFNIHYRAAIRQHRLIALPAADAHTSFVDARDVAATVAQILAQETHQWETLTLTGWESLSYTQTAEILSQKLGIPIAYRSLRDDAMRLGLQQRQWPQDSIEAMLSLFKSVRKGLHAALSQDVAAVLGRPPLTFAQYATDHLHTWI